MPWGFALFAGAVFVACCCLHIGQSGKYSDDYAITMRDFSTGGVDWSLHPWARYNYFWRPLHLALLWTVGTVFWEHDWVAHVLSALAHGGCAMGLWAWLRRMGISMRVSAVSGLLFLSNTLQAEAINWFSTICVSLGGITLIGVLELGRRGSAAGRSLSAGRVMAMALLSFSAACWYESSAAGLLALPLVMIAARPRGESVGVAMRRAIAPTAACGAACVVYAALLVGTAPSWQRGSAGRMVGPGDVGGRATWLAWQWWEWLVGQRGRDLWAGAWIEGAAWLKSPAGVVMAGVLMAAGFTAIVAWIRKDRGRVASDRHGGRLGWISLAGGALFVGAWVPFVLVKDHSVELRAWYTPLLGLAIVAACGLEGVLRVLAKCKGVVGRGIESVAGAALVCAVLLGVLAQMGWQRVFVRVWQEDEKRAAAIVAAAPNPAKDTVIMPLATKARGASTGRRFFDLAVEGGLGQSWSSWAFVQRAYKRRDITATNLSAWAPEQRPLSGFSQRGVWSTVHLRGEFEHSERGCFVPWERAIPIELGPDAEVVRLRAIRVLRPVEDDLEIGSVQGGQQAEWYGHHPGMVQFRDPDADWGRRLLRWSERTASGKESRVEVSKPRSAWPLIEVRVEGEGSRTLWTDLPPSTRNRVAVIRWLKAKPASKSGRSENFIARAGLSESAHAQEDVRWSAESNERFGRMIVHVPPQERKVRLWFEARRLTGEGAPAEDMVIDPGWLIEVADGNWPPVRGVPASTGEKGEYTPPTPQTQRSDLEDKTE